MKQYTNEQNTNRMRILITDGNKGLYFYQKPTLKSCKFTFADDSMYWEKMINTRPLKKDTV